MLCLSVSLSSAVSHSAQCENGHPRKRTWHLGILRGVKMNTLLWLVHVEAKPTVGVWAKTIVLPCISQILCLYLSEVSPRADTFLSTCVVRKLGPVAMAN